MTYWIAETSANSYPVTRDNWEKTKAKTIRGAKIAARHMQAFQGTTLYIAQGENKDNLRLVAFATADALNFAYKAVWVNCD
tara:strand:- start:382 stop:624 length:243 start_codon:yes stop_codon:yes gene_type:complete